MAAITRKPTKDKIGKQSGARVTSQQNRASQDTLREEQARRASLLLKQISDPTRLEIILTLADGEQHVGALCARLSQSQPAVSHHLALLRHGAIIAPRRQGKNHFYSLTKTGGDLAKIVHFLSDEIATERSAVRPRSTDPSSPQMQSPRPAVGTSNDSPRKLDLRSNRLDVNEEKSWGLLNRRRAELIFKKNRGRLNIAERSELEQLQALSLSRMQLEFPGPSHIDEQVRKIEERLRGNGAEKA